jgi:hypothetical protein
MSFTLQPVRVANGSDEEGLLVFNGQRRLVAVLTHLSDQYDGVSGHWYLEAGFGRLDGPDHPTFANLQEAQEWLRQHLPVMRGGGEPHPDASSASRSARLPSRESRTA